MRPALRPAVLPLALGLAFGAVALAGLGLATWHRDASQATLWGVLMLLIGLASLGVWRALRTEQARHAELERMAGELRRAGEVAEAANRSKGQFLANMSHELRTPFQGVLGMLQLLEQTPVNDLQRDMLRTAQDSATHLLALLNDILDISTIEAGRLNLAHAPIDLRRLVFDVRELMRVQAAERGLRLHVELAPTLPGWVRGDATRLKQILFNLLGNALKFTPRGEVRLRAEPTTDAAGRALLCFEVADTGVGMDAATLTRLFRRFELGDPTLSRRAGGAGLGLEISRTLARRMGGDITVRSTPGRGSAFTVTVDLPCCAPVDLPVPSTAPTARAEVPRAEHPLRVVVADDNAVNRKFLQLMLTRMGHDVVLCAHGQEAVDRVRREDHDVVLMDLHMPVLDGLAATRAIRRLPGRDGQLPVYGLTADTAERTHALASEAGLTRLLLKPVDAHQLADLLSAVEPGTGTAAGPAWAATQPDMPDWAGGDSAPATLPPPLSTRYGELEEQLPPQELPGLLDMFFDDRTRTLADLDAALAEGPPARIVEAAHKLKGSARLLGFRRIAHVAEDIERCIRRDRLHDLPRQRVALREAIDATREAVGMPG